MKHRIKKCKICQKYTLKESCPFCKTETNDPHPPKFSLEDKYIRYRVIDAHTVNKANSMDEQKS
jgi:H/ACA ribonucleoprotein complex subunit 3